MADAKPQRYRMFIDDTGNVDSGASNHPQRRFASITGVILEWDYLHLRFDPGFSRLKQRHFGLTPGGTPPVLHLRRLKKAEGPFRVLADGAKRKAWEEDCFSMYVRAQYSVVTVSVDKIAFYNKHPAWQGDVYELLVGNAIERFFYFLRNRNGVGDVMAEAVNGDADEVLKALYSRFYENGTQHIPAKLLQPVLTSKEIKIKPKNANISGLQLADLLASTCFSHCRRIYAGGPTFDLFAMRVAELIEVQKFYRDRNGDPHRYGRVWRP
jgi:hypothetical protein